MAINYRPIPTNQEVVKQLVKAVSLPAVPDTPESVERKMQAAKVLIDKVAQLNEVQKPDARKQAISIRIDIDVLEWLKAGGAGWQSRLNKALRAQMEASRP